MAFPTFWNGIEKLIAFPTGMINSFPMFRHGNWGLVFPGMFGIGNSRSPMVPKNGLLSR